MKRSNSQSPPRKAQGFVLIAVLGLLIVLSLTAGFIASYAERRLEQSHQLKLNIQSQLDSEATLATLMHSIATRPVIANALLPGELPATLTAERFDTFQARNELDITQHPRITLDGRRYLGLGQSAFAIQDEGSLLSLLEPDRERWTQLLGQFGLNHQQAERFLDQLQDYTDKDDLRRLNGATSQDYRRLNLPIPPQRLMISPGQIYNLLDARQLHSELTAILPFTTARSGQLHNINTAPQAVLQTMPGIDSDTARALINERRNKPFSSLSDANERLGRIIPLDALGTPTQASQYLRIQLWADASACRQSLWVGISSTPTSLIAPWEIDYTFTFDHEPTCHAPEKLAIAPLFDPAVAD